MKALENSRDYSISIIRLIATIFIVSCHVMQYLNLTLAWWLNVGVQIFLCMSGFLYGKKHTIDDDIKFYKKQFFKILLDYYIVVIIAIGVYLIFAPWAISAKKVFSVIITYGTLDGGGHLWYIPYCLFCYLITPFLSRLFKDVNEKLIILKLAILLIVTLVLIRYFLNYFNSAWIICYILGFFLGKITLREDDNRLYKTISILIVIFAVIANAIKITENYILKIELNGKIASLYNYFCDYAHVALGIAIFVSLRYILSKVIFSKGISETTEKICNCSDKYSYDIYLVHQFFILGPLSLMALTPYLAVNIVIILVGVVASAIFVRFLSVKVQSLIYKIKN